MDWSTFLAGRDLPAIMGIVNVTPDSFSDGGRYFSPPTRSITRGDSPRRAPI